MDLLSNRGTQVPPFDQPHFIKTGKGSNSTWQPPKTYIPLENWIQENIKDLNNSAQPKAVKKHNLNTHQRKALRSLAVDKSITIKPADKGGAILIMDTIDYILEADRQLSQESTYQKLDCDPTPLYQARVEERVQTMVENKEITKKVAKSLISQKPRTPQIYFLPKIHKNVDPPPGRPICSANGCPTERISSMVDLFLKPLVQKSDSYVKDTTDFIKKVENIKNISSETIIGTLDVTSLYTNIPNDEGIEVISETLKRERKGEVNPKNESLVDLLEMVLKNNNFQFNNENYLQISGTAMGTRVAPSYANLFMADLETKLLDKSVDKPTVWFRYIDDIFFIWENGEEKLQKWIDFLNQEHQSIKFTAEWSREKIHFLDTTVLKDGNGSLYTSLYTKPTDTNSFLRYDSAHAPNVKLSLPYSQFLRLRRICKKESDYKACIDMKEKQFLKKGYPQKLLDEAKMKVSLLDRTELLNKKSRKALEAEKLEEREKLRKQSKKDKNIEKPEPEQERIFLTTTFRPNYHKLEKIVKRNWDNLSQSYTTRGIQRMDLVTGYKRPKNLRDHLVRARCNFDPADWVKKEGEEKRKVSANICKDPECKVCPVLDKSGKISITNKLNRETKTNICCKSSNLIYCIDCKHCGKRYVGET